MARKSKRESGQSSSPAASTAIQSTAIQSTAIQSTAIQSTEGRRGGTQSDAGWRRGVLLPAMLSAVVLWASFPPLGWGVLAWVAPLGWLMICARPQPVGGRGYGALWLSGCLFWLLVLHGIRLAYWPLIFGWIALSLYLAVYLPLFVAATRVMHLRWKWPMVFAAPIAWLGLELIRSYLLTGYAANTLGHTQAHNPLVIQIADQLGVGGISWVIMTVAAALLPLGQQLTRRLTQPIESASKPTLYLAGTYGRPALAWAAGLVVATLGYGWWRLSEADRRLASQPALFRGLLLQENTPSMFDNYSPGRNQQSWKAYLELARQAAAKHAPLDLVVWPESTFTANEPWVEAEIAAGLPAELERENIDADRLMAWIEDLQLALHFKAKLVIDAVRQAAAKPDLDNTATPELGEAAESAPTWPHLLVGCDVLVYRTQRREQYNSALWIGPDARLLDRYGKMHLVMFGEYIPLGPLLQWLRDLVGLAGTDAGQEVKSFSLGSVQVAPSICFESMMPRVIQRQVRTLVAQGKSPDVLINITNDSWFRGSTMLDHHLACSMLCAVENRRPMLVAANTGLSAQIDGSGRLLQCSQRLQAQAILAEPKADSRWGLVQAVGYPLSWLSAVITSVALLRARSKE